MKHIRVTFEDKEFQHLDNVKPEGTSWRDFILTLAGYKKEVKHNETN